MLKEKIVNSIKKIPKFVIITLQIIISILFLWVIINKIDFSDLPANFFDIDPIVIIIAGLISIFANTVMVSLRMFLLFKSQNYDLKFKDIFNIHISTVGFKFLLPFKTGILLRSIIFQRYYDINIVRTTIYYFIVMATNFILLLIFYGIFTVQSVWVIYISIIMLVLLLLVSFIVKNKFKNVILYFITSVIFIALELVILYSIFYGYNIIFESFLDVSKMSLTLAISNVPITYHGVGLREYLLFKYFGNYIDFNTLFSISYWYLIVFQILPAILGIFFMKTMMRYIKR